MSGEEGEALAKEYNVPFFETSAKQDLNVESSFLKLATCAKERLMVDASSDRGAGASGNTKIGAANAAPKPKGGCC